VPQAAVCKLATHAPAWQFGSTPLHEASEHGYEEMVQLLIEKGTDVNAEDKVRTSGLAWRERRLGFAGH
jgi:hypothetical protein